MSISRLNTSRQRLPLLLLAMVLVLTLAAGSASADDVELSYLKGTFNDLDSDLQPVQQGPLTIHVSSPKHRLTVDRNRLTLTPNRKGHFDAAIEVSLDGEGHLIADLKGAGLDTTFTDDVKVPPQTVRASGEISLERADDGYVFTIERAGPAVALQIESNVAGQIVNLCRTLSFIPFFGASCDALEEGLSVVSIPMPEPGASFLLPASYLTEAEQKFFDDLITRE